MSNNFSRALDRDDLSIVCQPILPIGAVPTDNPDYFEVLLRVKELSPITFLNRLTKGEYRQLDVWIVEQVNQLPAQYRYAINLSPFSLIDRSFIQKLMESDRQLVIEITEHHAISSRSDWLIEVCRHFPVMLDDIGSAYSGLNRLCEFRFKGIKIDGQLILQIQESAKARAIVGGLMRMAQDLGVCCVCEYVETIDLWNLLQDIHAEYAPELDLRVQGWAVGVPSEIEARSLT